MASVVGIAAGLEVVTYSVILGLICAFISAFGFFIALLTGFGLDSVAGYKRIVLLKEKSHPRLRDLESCHMTPCFRAGYELAKRDLNL